MAFDVAAYRAKLAAGVWPFDFQPSNPLVRIIYEATPAQRARLLDPEIAWREKVAQLESELAAARALSLETVKASLHTAGLEVRERKNPATSRTAVAKLIAAVQAEAEPNLSPAERDVVEELRTRPQPPLTSCAADRDGECTHAQCPQNRDFEPETSGRYCPLDSLEDRE